MSSNCVTGGKSQTIIMCSYLFDCLSHALIPSMFGELGSLHSVESVDYAWLHVRMVELRVLKYCCCAVFLLISGDFV